MGLVGWLVGLGPAEEGSEFLGGLLEDAVTLEEFKVAFVALAFGSVGAAGEGCCLPQGQQLLH